jgi:hypothetical protein
VPRKRRRPLACRECGTTEALIHLSGSCAACANKRYQARRESGAVRAAPRRCGQCKTTEGVIYRSGYCPSCAKQRTQEWLAEHPHYARDWAQGRPRKPAPPRDPEKSNAYNRARSARIRVEVLEHYGGRCACCGETEFDFLTIDHPDMDGTDERKRLRVHGGPGFYHWLRKEGFPTHVRLLCYNCNLGARHHGGVCPHAVIA